MQKKKYNAIKLKFVQLWLKMEMNEIPIPLNHKSTLKYN